MVSSRSSKPQKKGVIAPTSSAMVQMFIRWLAMREISLYSTRMYWARLGISSPSRASTASA